MESKNNHQRETFSEEYSAELGDFNANKVFEILAESKSEDKKKDKKKNV